MTQTRLTPYFADATAQVFLPQVGDTFWAAIPPGCFYPVFIIATLASIIASQALISAVFQVAKQALTHGFLPRLAVFYTNRKVRVLGCLCCDCPALGFCSST